MHEPVRNVSIVEYPTADGKPVAESDLHFQRLTYVAHVLKIRYETRADVFVGANLLVYDTPGNPRRHLSPDVFVAFGVADGDRDLFKIWEERPPSFVLEVTSKSTRGEDMGTKRQRYAAWGVDEYFLYDPRGEYLTPPLQGLALRAGAYRPLPRSRLPNGERGYRSAALGVHLWLKGSELRLFDPATGQDLRTHAEEAAARRAAEARAEDEAAVRRAAEARAEDETAARVRAEARIAELEARIRKQRIPPTVP